MPRDVQLDWLRTFIAVVEQGSFSAAAQTVQRSQPRVSSHIAALESAVGASLLHRTPARLTPAGETLLPHARDALRSVERGIARVAALGAAVRGPLRVASFPGASALLVAPIFRSFTDRYPDVRPELLEGVPDEITDLVLGGRADVAVLPAFPPLTHATLVRVPLLRESIVALVRTEHELAGAPSVPTARLRDERVVVTAKPGDQVSYIADVLRAAEIPPDTEVHVAQPTTVAAFVNAGLGIGLLPAMAAETVRFGELVAVPMTEHDIWERTILLVRNAERELSRVASLFLHDVRRAPLPPGVTWAQPATPAQPTTLSPLP